MKTISEKRLNELVKRLNLLDYQADGQGFLTLELGFRTGLLATGYPLLRFSQYKDQFIIDVTIPSGEQGYDTRREIEIDEMLIFVFVAKSKFPQERMTKELIEKVKSILIDKKTEANLAIEQIDRSLKFIEELNLL